MSFSIQMFDYLHKHLLLLGISSSVSEILTFLLTLCFITVVTYISYALVKRYLLRYHIAKLKASSSDWSRMVLRHNILPRLYVMIPLVLFYAFVQMICYSDKDVLERLGMFRTVIDRVVFVWFVVLGVMLLSAILNLLNSVYSKSSSLSAQIPIRSYVDFVKLTLWVVAGILIATIVTGTSISGVLAGLGALSALTLLIFKDSILGFISNIQLSAYDVVRVGDWIEMPSYNVYGSIVDITLNTVKVQNFNKSLVTVPSSDLLAKGVINWRGMFESGGRRMERYFRLDTRSVRFCDQEMLEKLKSLPLISSYLEGRMNDLKNDSNHRDMMKYLSDIANKNRGSDNDGPESGVPYSITNLELYVRYIYSYLNSRPDIYSNDDRFSTLVRYSSSCENGLKLELYTFSRETGADQFYKIENEVTQECVAMANEFGLKMLQSYQANS